MSEDERRHQGADETAHDPLVDRAVRLFEFLGRSQQLRNQPARDVDSYRREGAVLWLKDLPHHSALHTALRQGEPAVDDPVLTVERVARADPPVPDDQLREWLDGPLDDPETAPALRASVFVVDDAVVETSGPPAVRSVALEERPEITELFDLWMQDWRPWALQERRDSTVRSFYGDLFAIYVTAAGHPEELELVVGVGCLTWAPADHPAVRRHVLTAPISVHFDDDTGRLSVTTTESSERISVEIDMLDPGLITNPQHVNDVRERARDLMAHPLHRDQSGALVRRIVHTLAPDAEYRDADEIGPAASHPIAAFAPAIILRKRSQRGLVEIFRTIVDQLKDRNSVPEGVLPLIDPDHLPQVDAGQCEGGQAEGERDDGALVRVDDDPFLPLPVNDVQLRILRQVDSHAQTLVQGPPGTGKTHTAAALICHLLAQGKRVLVTAHTDRALKEIRAKLPEAIQPLAVAVVGTSREDMSNLRVAVARIADTAANHDADDAALAVAGTLHRIDELRRQRAAVYRDLLSAREHEVHAHEFGGYRGTLAAIAQQHDIDSARLGWLQDYVADVRGPAPLGNVEILEWRALLTDDSLRADEADALRRLLDVSCLPDALTFADLVQADARAARDDARLGSLKGHPAFGLVSHLDRVVREDLQSRLHQLAGEIDSLSGRPEAWMGEALSDTRTGRASLWEARGQEISALIARATPLVQQLGSVTDIAATGELGRLVPLALELQDHLATGGRIKPGANGMPKIGPFTARQIKQAQPLFEAVGVDGAPPTTATQLTAFLIWAEATKTLAALDYAWPASVSIPPEDTLRERLQWHVGELAQLGQVLEIAAELTGEEERFRRLGLPFPGWNDLSAIRTYAELVDAAATADALAAARAPLERLQQIAREAHWPDAVPAVHGLLQSVTERDHERYSSAMTRLHRLTDVRRAVGRRDELGHRLAAHAPLLCAAITGAPHHGDWSTRIDTFTEAWAWAAASTWIRERKALDVNALQTEVTRLEQEIRTQVETLAATRAWNHAVAPDRLSRGARASLEHYAYLVRRLGKGTGKYQAQRKAEIRQAMDRCRPAVPVWILPIYRIADQLRIQPDMFDVVIVDEASQAGLEAIFLQYLAPRIVVIGDDKQVSPSAVGVDQQQLRDLAGQYLHDDPYRSSWQDPQRSLFDEAKMRFSGMLTLVEHRRCVPEIIGFSNRIAYEPDGIRLIPVRQYGADRLEPIKTVFLAEGYERGSAGHKINQVEVEAIVDTVIACIADPRYDGLTFGVISLLGQAQAKTIEKQLLDAVPPEAWTARDLRCGDAADFQGSERDVMFLSMVAAPEPGKRSMALTQDLYMQRYNVAASRAKDQMWIFHSISLNDLGNQQDMRFQLLDYSYGVQRRSRDDDDRVLTAPVPEDVQVRPFDSLFEQRVCNRLIDRGYTVIPQYPVQGYQMDLVVVGAKARLAIECDGDAWHGPDAYQRDMARQRELERCGWTFFRVRESEFYVDKAAALAELWEALAELEIHPSGWTPDQPDDPGFPTPDPGPEPHPESESRTDPGPESELEPVLEPARHPMEPPEAYTQDVVPAGTRPPGPAQDRLGAYRPFTETLLPITSASPSEIIEGLVAITAAEGPILGHRLHSVYVKAAGGQRVGPQIAKVLNTAIHTALRQGLLAEDDPLGEPEVTTRTFRLPNQKAVIVRHLGPRTLEQVPPGELAEVMWHAAEGVGWDDQDRLFRATLAAHGLKRLTPNVASRLRAVWSLARTQPPA